MRFPGENFTQTMPQRNKLINVVVEGELPFEKRAKTNKVKFHKIPDIINIESIEAENLIKSTSEQTRLSG